VEAKVMKNRKTLTIVILCLVSLGCFPIAQIVIAADAPDIEWERIYESYETGRYIEQTNDGGYIVITIDRSLVKYTLLKLNSDGVEEWNKTFGKSMDDVILCVNQLSNGGYIISGTEVLQPSAEIPGRNYVWLIKTDNYGMEQWNKTYEEYGSSSVGRQTVQETTDGEYIIIGSYGGGINLHPLLIKTDATGNKIWSRKPSSTAFRNQGFVGQQTKDDGYIIAGSYDVQTENSQIWLIKTDEFGYTLWDKKMGGNGIEVGMFVQQTTDGGYIIIGNTKSYGNGNMDVWLVKTDENGNETWSKTFGGKDYDYSSFIQETSDGGYIITASYTDPYGKIHPWIIKTNRNGDGQWEENFSDTNKSFSIVKQTTDNGYIICGGARPGNYYYDDLLIIKMRPDTFLPDQSENNNDGHQDDTKNNSSKKSTPGFELVFVMCAIAVSILLWKKKENE
jgi:hypothetical protein